MHPYSLTRVVVQTGVVLSAVHQVAHPIAFDALLVLLLVAHVATLHDLLPDARWMAPRRAVIAHAGTDHRAGHGGCVPAAAAAELMADHAADDAAQQGASAHGGL